MREGHRSDWKVGNRRSSVSRVLSRLYVKIHVFDFENVNVSMGNNVSILFNNFIKQRRHVYRVYITFYEIGYILLEVHIPQRTLTPFISASAIPLPFLLCFVNKPSIYVGDPFSHCGFSRIHASIIFNLVSGYIRVRWEQINEGVKISLVDVSISYPAQRSWWSFYTYSFAIWWVR